MNAQQKHAAHRRSRILHLLRQCYQTFLLHLILSLCVTVVLLLSAAGLSSFLPEIPGYLQSAALFLHRPSVPCRLSETAISQAVFAYSVYMPDTDLPGTYRPAASDKVPSDAPFEAHSINDRSPTAAQHTKDDEIIPTLEKPTLNGKTTAENTPSTAIPADHIRIRSADLSLSDQYTEANGGILFSNQTTYSVQPADFLTAEYPITALSLPAMTVPDVSMSDRAPLVLILHTHGTEAYAPKNAASVPQSYAYRSENISENVVSVGAILADTLRRAGISVLHCTTMFDAASYNDSYSNAASYIQQTVAAYPSIAYIFDVHRDALKSSDGSMLRPITTVGGEVCAQVMSVVGTDNAGGNHPAWRNNLTVAVQLQKRLNEAYPAFTRPINLRSATFNGQYAPGSLLLEIGAAGNSIAEARSAAYRLGTVLADLILDP